MTFAEIKTVQNFADGRIRQIGVWCSDRVPSEDDLVAIQDRPTRWRRRARNCRWCMPRKGQRETNLHQAGRRWQMPCQRRNRPRQAAAWAELYKDKANAAKASVSGLGVVLGLISKAKVHQCIAWVKRNFPPGISLPAFGDGTLLRDLDKALVEQLDTARYLFFVTSRGRAAAI